MTTTKEILSVLTESLEICETLSTIMFSPGGACQRHLLFKTTDSITNYEINILLHGGLRDCKAIKEYSPHIQIQNGETRHHTPYKGGLFEVDTDQLNTQTQAFLNRLEEQDKIRAYERSFQMQRKLRENMQAIASVVRICEKIIQTLK